MLLQRQFQGRAVGAAPHHVGDQAFAARRVFAGDDHALQYAGLVHQRGFDLTQLNAHAANLDLEVAPAQVFQSAIGQVAHLVAGAVQPLARRKRVRDKTFGGQLGAVQVATRQAGAADVQLARHAHGHGLPKGIQHITLRVGDGPADGYGGCAAEVAAGHAVGAVVGGLAGAVKVAQRGVWKPALKRARQVQAHGLAAAHHVAQVHAGFQPRFVEQQIQQRRHQHDGGDALFTQGAHQVAGVAVLAGFGQHHRGATQQRHEKVRHRRVEGDGRHLQDAVAARHAQQIGQPQFVVAQRAVRHHHALGLAGGA